MDNKKKKGLLIDSLLFVGWGLVSAGAALLSLSAGLIVAGVLAIAGGIALARGGDDG